MSFSGSSRRLVANLRPVDGEGGDDLRGDGGGAEAFGVVGVGGGPDAGFGAFGDQGVVAEDVVGDHEGGVVPAADGAFDGQAVAEDGGAAEGGAGGDQWDADDAVAVHQQVPVEAGAVEQAAGALVEPGEVVRVEDDLGWVGVAPLDNDLVAVEPAVLTLRHRGSAVGV